MGKRHTFYCAHPHVVYIHHYRITKKPAKGLNIPATRPVSYTMPHHPFRSEENV